LLVVIPIMPLLNGKVPHELLKTKPKPNREYFVIRFTNEHFKKYSDYLDHMDKYRLRQWTCSITNKTNLTYEEALMSEKKAIDKVSKFSEVLLPHCLRMIQYKDSNLDDLRDTIYDHFNSNYFPQEMITFKAEGTKYTGRILSLVSSSSSSSSSELESKNNKSATSSSSSTLSTKSNGATSSKSTRKSKLSEINLKRKSDDSASGVNDIDNSSDDESRKRRKPLYPIEDNEVDRTTDEAASSCPIPSCNFISSTEMYGDLLMTWHFLNQFEKVLQLSPFSIEDFESALQHSSETTLLVETHIRLLKLVFGLSIYSHGTPKKHFSIKMLTDRNWLTLLKVYFSYESRRLELEEKKKADRKKQLAEQNDKMMCLASDIPNDDEGDISEEELKKKEQDFEDRMERSKAAMDGEEEEDDGDIEMADDDEVAHDDDGEAILQEDDESSEPSNIISSNDPDNIIRVLRKRNYFRLRVDEKLHILSYLVMQAIQSDRIRRHLDEITEFAGEIRQEKRELVLEERKIKKEEDQQMQENAAAVKKGKKGVELGKIQKKEENLDQQLVKYSSRLEPLGQDRDHHKYWYWTQLPGRIYIEHTKGDWAYFTSRQELDDLVQYLDNRGVRERKLLTAIKLKYDVISTAIEQKTQQITAQLALESKRSARIKAIYGDRTYVGYTNKY
ncbi:hypothetical protein SAMD00019534_058730, partial [Acytostelium subglobosum LB1]|uniref:hypothetical protein n=1 Tax=Acytostelium subglobosum LB1 TaxID=1410327 RepID=UPI0006450284